MHSKQVNKPSRLLELYESDYYLWLQETSRLLKARNFENIDIENLIEEIESLGRSERNKLISGSIPFWQK